MNLTEVPFLANGCSKQAQFRSISNRVDMHADVQPSQKNNARKLSWNGVNCTLFVLGNYITSAYILFTTGFRLNLTFNNCASYEVCK